MYLKTAPDIAAAVGAQCAGRAPEPDDIKFIAMLNDTHARIEDSLNIPSLQLFGYTDKFELHMHLLRNTETFRLHGGFVDPSSVIVTDPIGAVVNSDRLTIDGPLGTVMIDNPIYGRYTIQYNAGFAVDEDNDKLLAGTPSWLRALLDPAAVIWFRTITVQAAKVPEGMSFGQIMQPVYRDLTSRIYSRYQRPRVRVHLPYACTPSVPFEVA